jgi:L-fuconolactonase
MSDSHDTTRPAAALTRRSLLAALFAGAGAGCARGGGGTGAPPPRGAPSVEQALRRPDRPAAVDTHTHFYDPARPQGVPWPPPVDALLYRAHMPEEFISLTAPLGVGGAIVVEASPWLEDNQWLLDLADAHPVILGVVGNLTPGGDGFAQHLARFTRHPLFKGIRIGAQRLREGLGTRVFDADVRRLADAGLSLDLLGGEAMLPDAAALARAVPPLRIVVDHLPFAAWDGDLAAARRALDPFRELPRVYAKVSGVMRPGEPGVETYRPRLDLLWEVFGADRVMFASNWPVSNRLVSYDAMHRAVAEYARARGAADTERFFWRTSRDVYRWEWRRPLEAQSAFAPRTLLDPREAWRG